MDTHLNMSDIQLGSPDDVMVMTYLTEETSQLTEMALVHNEVTAVHLFSTLHHTHTPSLWRQLLQLHMYIISTFTTLIMYIKSRYIDPYSGPSTHTMVPPHIPWSLHTYHGPSHIYQLGPSTHLRWSLSSQTEAIHDLRYKSLHTQNPTRGRGWRRGVGVGEVGRSIHPYSTAAPAPVHPSMLQAIIPVGLSRLKYKCISFFHK